MFVVWDRLLCIELEYWPDALCGCANVFVVVVVVVVVVLWILHIFH